jgi:hypothetical protein
VKKQKHFEITGLNRKVQAIRINQDISEVHNFYDTLRLKQTQVAHRPN